MFLGRLLFNSPDTPQFCDNRDTSPPTYYGIGPDPFDDWLWYAGTDASKCVWQFPPVMVDDADAAMQYTGSWTHSTGDPRTIRQTVSWTNVSGNKAYNTATPAGYSITRIYDMASNRGNYTVKINGNTVGSGSDYSSDVRRRTMRTFSASGSTTMELTNNGGGFIDVDAYAIDIPRVAPIQNYDGFYDDFSYMIQYVGSWQNAPNIAYARNQTESFTNIAQDGATFTFDSSLVTFYFSKATNRGIAAVTIDGTFRETIDMYASSTQGQQTRTYSNLGSGVHTIHISNTGQKNPNSTNY